MVGVGNGFIVTGNIPLQPEAVQVMVALISVSTLLAGVNTPVAALMLPAVAGDTDQIPPATTPPVCV